MDDERRKRESEGPDRREAERAPDEGCGDGPDAGREEPDGPGRNDAVSRSGPPLDRLIAGGVAMATAGLSGCGDDGTVVDPAPPPLQCDRVDEGQSLDAVAEIDDRDLTVRVLHQEFAAWETVEVTDVEGAEVVGVAIESDLAVEIALRLEEAIESGSFTLEGTLRGRQDDVLCDLSRTFQFTISGDSVQVTHRGDKPPLPLAARQRAQIRLLRQEGRRVEVEGFTRYRNPRDFRWAVSDGRVLTRDGARLAWELPGRPGFYQVELVVDYGSDGFSIDTMSFEVT